MAVIFKSLTKHGTLQFLPGQSLAFKDARAEEYFVAAGFAEKTSKKAIYTYDKGSIEIDTGTVFNKTGEKVL